MASILILSGPIGAGKTTVARALLDAATPPTAYVEGDVFWSFLVKPEPRTRQRNIQTIMRAMVRTAAAMAGDGWDVLLDFSIPPAFAARAVTRLKDLDVRYVELRADLATCAERAAGRAEGVIADYQPYEGFHALFDADDRFVVRTDDKGPSETAAIIRQGLAAGHFRLG